MEQQICVPLDVIIYHIIPFCPLNVWRLVLPNFSDKYLELPEKPEFLYKLLEGITNSIRRGREIYSCDGLNCFRPEPNNINLNRRIILFVSIYNCGYINKHLNIIAKKDIEEITYILAHPCIEKISKYRISQLNLIFREIIEKYNVYFSLEFLLKNLKSNTALKCSLYEIYKDKYLEKKNEENKHNIECNKYAESLELLEQYTNTNTLGYSGFKKNRQKKLIL